MYEKSELYVARKYSDLPYLAHLAKTFSASLTADYRSYVTSR
jgi:hypothetical protein